jgi:hypothetical protein
VQQIINQWNGLGLNQIKTIKAGTERHKLLKKRIKDYGADTILEAISKVGKSSFLCGHNNKGWTITFDWFIRPNNFPKVLDGNYDDRNAIPKNTKVGAERMTDLDGIF